MAKWNKSQNYKLRKKIENNKKKQVEDIANGKEPREYKMPETRRSTAADALDSYIARRAAREQIYGNTEPIVTGSTRTPGDIMGEAIDRLRNRLSTIKSQVGTSPVEARIPTAVPTTNPRNMVTAESKLKKPNYVGNNGSMTVSRDLVDRVARNADNSRAELDRKAVMINSGAYQRQQLLRDLDSKARAEETKRMDLQRQAEAERQKRGIDQNVLSAAALDQIKNMKNGDGTTLSGTVPNYTPIQQDEYRNTKEYQWARRHPEAASAVSVFTNPITGIEGLVNTGRQFVNPEKMDPNQLKGAYFQSALREGITRGKKDDLSKDSLGRRIGFKDDGRNSFAENVSDFLVNTGIDAINSTAGNLMMGPVNIAAMSGNAAQSKLYDALQDKDTSRNQALATSAAFGIAEALFEKVSFENLMKWNLNPKTLGDFAKNVVRSVVAEGSEEVNTDIANDISDIFINRDNSEAGRIYNDYLLRGADPRQAFVYTLGDRIKNYGLSFLGGGLSGGASAIGGAMYGAYQNRQQQRYNDALEAYKRARTNAYLEQGQSLGQSLAEADINVWDDAAKAGVGFYLDEGEETNGNYVFELDNNENIVSDEVSGTVEESSTVKQDTDDLVNAAVDELIRQQQEEIQDTSESTPDEAKNLTEIAVNELNNQAAAEEAVPEVPEDVQIDENDVQKNVHEEPEPVVSRENETVEESSTPAAVENDTESKELSDKRMEYAKKTGTNYANPEDWVSDNPVSSDTLRDSLGVFNRYIAGNFEYTITADENGRLVGTIRDISGELMGGMINDARSTRYKSEPKLSYGQALDDLVSVAKNNGFTTDKVNSNDKLQQIAEETVDKTPEQAAETTESNAKADFDAELDRRSKARFPQDPDAQKFYNKAFEEFADEIGVHNEPMSIITSYDDNMAKAYQAGLNGKSLSSLDNNESFRKFYELFPDLAEGMNELGNMKRNKGNAQGGETNDNGSGSDAELLHGPGTSSERDGRPVRGGAGMEDAPIHSEQAGELGGSRDSIRRSEGQSTVDEGQRASSDSAGVLGGRSEGDSIRSDAGSAERGLSGEGDETGGENPDAENGIENGRADGSREQVEAGRADGRGSTEESGETGQGDRSDLAPLEPKTEKEEAQQIKDLADKQKPKGDNYVISDDFKFPSTIDERLKANLDAIKTLHNILDEGRTATKAEQDLLAKYTGWGGFSQYWWKYKQEIKKVLTDKEFNDASASITSAFYTDPDIIRAMYKGIESLGFNGGRVLEPSAGVGRFIGCMPENMIPGIKRMTAAELDTVTGNIAKLLYPNSKVIVDGFQNAKLTNNQMDLVIGNVPFGDFGVADKRYPKKVTSLIHNYFIARSLDTLRPGGVLCVITSKGTMDSKNSEVRQYIQERAELMGAIRLPNSAFKGTNTGTVTDILVFRKREKGKPYIGEKFQKGAIGEETRQVWDKKGKGAKVVDTVTTNYKTNEYFLDHPEMVLGQLVLTHGRYGMEYTVAPDISTPLSQQIEDAFSKIKYKMTYPEIDTVKEQQERGEARNKKVGTAYTVDDVLYKNVNGEEVVVDFFPEVLKEKTDENEKNKAYNEKPENKDKKKKTIKTDAELKRAAETEAKKRLETYKDSMAIRDTVKDLQAAQRNGATEKEKKALRKKLNTQYDAFLKKHKLGFHDASARKTLINDTDFFLLQSLETLKEKRNGVDKAGRDKTEKYVVKSDIFTKDTIGATKEVTHVNSIDEGIEASIAKKGYIDTKYIGDLMGQNEEKVSKDLDADANVFKDENDNYVHRTDYLSGNVRAKLHVAERLAETDEQYKRNVEELKKVLPSWVKGTDIKVQVGASWIPEHIYDQFIDHLMGKYNVAKVKPRRGVGFDITGVSKTDLESQANTKKWGIEGYGLLYENTNNPGLLWYLLNNENIKLYKKDENGHYVKDANDKKIFDEQATEAAKAMLRKINNEFQNWLWEDSARRDQLEDVYNEVFNNYVEPLYDSKVEIQNQNPAIELREHQGRAVNRIIRGEGNTLLEHGVGAGKTFAAIAAGIKLKQLGLVSKPVYVVPKGKVPDWANDFYKLKPDARLLVATEETFASNNRKKFTQMIANNDYDAIVMSYEQFKMLPLSDEYETEYVEKKIAELRNALEDDNHSRKEKKGRTQSQLERIIAKYQKKLDELKSFPKDKDNIFFEETGIDHIFVDEAQNYKNLLYYTNLSNVADMGDPEGSERAFDMKMKVDFVRSLSGRGITFLTATPIMNSPVEAYNMLTYLAEDELHNRGIYSLDDFIKVFGRIEDLTRLDAAGDKFVTRTTFNGFTNLREWSQFWHTIVDRVKTSDIPDIKLPKMKGGERNVIECEAGPLAKRTIAGLPKRLQSKDKKGKNHIFGVQADGKKASFSQKLLDPNVDYGEHEKVPVAVDKIFHKWEESKEFVSVTGDIVHNGTQLIFCDYGVPSNGKKAKTEKAEGEKVADDDQYDPNEEISVEGVNVYQDMKNMLIAKGVPAEEIAFMQDYKGKQLETLFNDVREGKVRILIGSTKVMGEGLNVQDRIVAIHEMNPVMRPGDVEQLEGRAIRQGNLSPEVEVNVYVTKGTFDLKQWENLRTKAEYISLIEDGFIDGREIEYSTSEFGASAADIMSIAAADPRIKEKADLDQELRRLNMLKKEYDEKQYRAKKKLDDLKIQYDYAVKRYEQTLAASKKINDVSGDKFKAKVAGRTFENREEFGQEIIKYVSKYLKDRDYKRRRIGTIAGTDIWIAGDVSGTLFLQIDDSSSNSFSANLDSAKGTVQTLENNLKKFKNDYKFYEGARNDYEKDISDIKKVIEEKFEQADKLAELTEKSEALEKDLKENPINYDNTVDPDVQFSIDKKKGEVRNSKENKGTRKLTPREEAQKKAAEEFEASLRPDKWDAFKNMDSDAEVKRFEDILGEAAHDFGFQYTPGKRYVRGKDIGGWYNLVNKGIRLKVANNLSSFSHEFGHWLMDKYGINKETVPDTITEDIKNAFYAEYEDGQYADDEVLNEGLAEFIRHYTQNRDTAFVDYPQLFTYIRGTLSKEDLNRFDQLADEINAAMTAGANEITQHTVQHEESLRDYREFGKKVHDAMVDAQINWVDSNYGFKDFDYEYGTPTHMFATNAEYIDGTIGYAMDGQLRDLDGNYLGLSLKDCLRGINLDPKSQEFRDFGDYLVVRHAPERLALGMRTYADDRQNNQKWMQARQAELEEKYPQFAAAAENLDTFQKNVLKHYALKCGLITPEAYKNMLKDYPHYVPFFRTGFKEKGNALRRAHGSGRTIINPVDNIITSTMKIMNASSRNAILLAMRSAALGKNANALFLEQIPDPQVPITFDMRGVKEALHNRIADINVARGVDPTAQDLLHDMVDKIDNTLTQFQTGRARKDLNEIAIMVNGKPEFWKVNDENLFKSLTSMDYRTSNTLITMYGRLTRFMTSNTTGNNVIWSIFSNSPRDFQTLMNYSDDKNILKLAKLIGDSYIQSFNEFRGEATSDYYSEFLAMGAKGAPVWAGSETYVKDMRKLINSKKGFNPANLNPFKYFRFLAETIEMGPRYATYRLMREKGMSPQQAFYGAMDVTTNFRKKGIYGKELNKAVQFFNANVQGLDHAVRYYSAEDLKGKDKAIRNKAIKARMTFLVATSLITAMLSYAWNHRDKDDKDQYNLLSNYIKNYYFTVHLGDGKFFSIPKNHELSVLESFFERVFERLADDNDQAFNEYFDYFAEQVMPPIASEILKFPVHAGKDGLQQAMDDAILGVISNTGVYGVAAQTAMNKNYLGAKIVPTAYKNLAPKKQYNKKTSEAAYLIGQALNISPMKLDHFAGNVLGYIWDYQSALFPINAGNVKGERDPYLGVTKKYVRDNRYSNDVSGWIYDKARESKMRYETEGDNLLEASMDEYMKNRYNTYNKLSKDEEETEKSRDTRSDVLQELIDYRKGRMSGDFKTVSSLVEETGDHNYLPSVMDKTYKNGKGGENINFTSEEYIQLQNIYEDLYLTYMNESIDKNESVEKWEYTKTKAKNEAKNRALDELLRQKGIEPKTTKPKTSPGKFDAYVDAEFKKKKK